MTGVRTCELDVTMGTALGSVELRLSPFNRKNGNSKLADRSSN